MLVTFENETNVIKDKLKNVEIICPSYAINAENPVAAVARRQQKGTNANDAAKACLEHLYSGKAQKLAVKCFVRPDHADILAEHQDKFPEMAAVFPSDVFGGWRAIMETCFKEGGVYDKLAVGTTGGAAKAGKQIRPAH